MAAKDVIASGKDLLAMLRDLFLFVVGMLLILWPSFISDRLQKAGFEEGSFLGMKWKNSLAATYAAYTDAKALNKSLQSQNDSLVRFIASLSNSGVAPQVQQEIAGISVWNARLNDSNRVAGKAINATVQANAPLIRKAQEAVSTGNRWGVVFSADATLNGALYEKNTGGPAAHLTPVDIYFRQGTYRSVCVVDSRDDADSVLELARKRRSDSYIVPMSSWCPDAADNGAYKTCPSGH